MFISELISRLIEHYLECNDGEICNSYIVDESHEFKEELVKNSENILFFKGYLITSQDYNAIKPKLDKAYKVCKNISILNLFLNPKIVEIILGEYPEIVFYPVYHSSLLDSQIRDILESQFTDKHSFNTEFLDAESICMVFRKKMLHYFDDNDN